MAQIEERLVELINLASIEVDVTKKVEYLYQIKELALNHGLLANFCQDILAFQSDRAPNVKKFVLAFIEAACKSDCQLCPKAILSLNLLLNDTNTEVIKRSVQVASQFYRFLVQWIAYADDDTVKTENEPASGGQTSSHLATANQQLQQQPSSPSSRQQNNERSGDIEKTWLMWLQIEGLICGLLDSTNNDGVRTHCIKFIETIALMQTPKDKYTDTGNYELNLIDPMIEPVQLSEEATLCGVSGLPKNGILFNEVHKLELVEAAKRRFEQLVVFHGTSHISSVNLMAAMQSLVVLAKQRYRLFMGRVIQAMEALNTKLPPTLTESQVQSVRKFLKVQLTVMLKHPYSLDRFQTQITQLLQAVGSKQPEIHKVISDFKHKFGGADPSAAVNTNATASDIQKRIKLEPGITVKQQPTSQGTISSQIPVGKTKHLDLNKLTQELDEAEKRQIVVDSVKRILGEEKRIHIHPAQMEIKKKVLSTLANEFNDTECPRIIQDYIFGDLKNRHEICYAIIKKNLDVAKRKAAKRQVDLLYQDGMLLQDYIECLKSYLDRAQALRDTKDRDVILPKLYELKDEYYELFERGQSEQADI